MAKTYGEFQRELRLEANMSLRDIADPMGWSIPYVSDIERNLRNPPAIPHIKRISELLGKPECFQKMYELAAKYRGEVTVAAKHQNDLDAVFALNRRIESGGISSEDLKKLRRLLNADD